MTNGAVSRVELIATGECRKDAPEYFEVEISPAEIASLGLEAGKRVRLASHKLALFNDTTQGRIQ